MCVSDERSEERVNPLGNSPIEMCSAKFKDCWQARDIWQARRHMASGLTRSSQLRIVGKLESYGRHNVIWQVGLRARRS